MSDTRQWLASVKSLAEAQQLSSCLPDMLDMKQPDQGALGALPVGTVTEIVDWVKDRCLTSATVGDLPMQAETIISALQAMQSSGVDYLKVGIFESKKLPEQVTKLNDFLQHFTTPVIAVLFVDDENSQSALTTILNSNFSGVMLDTAEKNGKTLLDHMPEELLAEFVQLVVSNGKLCGLAGALKLDDIAVLKGLGADYLGFRSALCPDRQRQRRLDPHLAMQVQKQLNNQTFRRQALA
ncbi:(5-formylfuran-3-yl)methyl phosphate synthase [Methylophaga sp. OBS3]|uniref:(5-formylfuran-3-yl)methyl phosphate synthase n=1 Tax=Methylophaga sp. OBS3 TaxID=2991934 RepID=UPI00225BBD8C|nr:(5-formylfuran-3-yl)methyl phosphate synthase [Methylophaga sp. OBS3]MCX4189734.1 (5-formylfuran-3-yl)methyl phosphate synthase [Methylophaga sp. OBS3]